MKGEAKMKHIRKGRRGISLVLAVMLLFLALEIPVKAEVGTDALGRVLPKNPVYDSETDRTAWSYVYFGSYPQTEVTGEELTEDIIQAEYGSSGDADVNGVKYRRISIGDTIQSDNFGEDTEYRYFKWEKIKWRVLQNSGSDLFVMADSGLDYRRYHESSDAVTWETSTLRSYLNDDFFHTAFNSREQGAVVRQTVKNTQYTEEQGIVDGTETDDYVYLLSKTEVTDRLYGFLDSEESSVSREVSVTDYTYRMGAFATPLSDGIHAGIWHLRSAGRGQVKNARVWEIGSITDIPSANTPSICVPVLHIDLSSDQWSTEENGGGNTDPPGDNPEEPADPANLANPVYDAGTDTTEWSYVYYGSYPQTEVTGNALTSAITGARYNAEGDAWVNGTKYRRISIGDVSNDTNFGDASYRYYKWNRIRWRVLQNDGDFLIVMADQVLDVGQYHNRKADVTWESSHLRSWLNGIFYETAFSSDEQYDIWSRTVANENNPVSGTLGGADTTDDVSLLSIAEATNPDYGFCSDYTLRSKSRQMLASEYAYARGTSIYESYGNCCIWWLRSPGGTQDGAADVVPHGGIAIDDNDVRYNNVGFAPVIKIDIDSEYLYLEDDDTSGAGGEDTGGQPPVDTSMNPRHQCTSDTDDTGETDVTEWSYIYFGSYPQTEITGAALTSDITGAAYDSNGDAWVNDVKYRRISRANVNRTDNFGGATYRYFKWERIKWRVLQDEGDDLFLMADEALDCKRYHNQRGNVTWETGMLRGWLNQTFYNEAFSGREQADIIQQNVINEENPYTGIRGGNNTRDFVYLLSFDEAINESYGFCSSFPHSSMSRRFQASEYAYRMGTEVSEDDGCCMWWMRSPGGTEDGVVTVFSFGTIDHDDDSALYGNMGCIPVLHISRSSELWQEEDDGTSGDGGENPIAVFDPVHTCTKDSDATGDSDTTVWDTIYFGSYPQTEVTGSSLTSAIRNAAYNSNGDAWVNGTKYRRISRADTNNDSFFGNAAYRYFKWERIKWRILKKEGDTLFIMADQILDCKRYHNRQSAVTWEGSALRSWLNGTFYPMAFDSNEQKTIVQQTVINESNPYTGISGGRNTSDYISLLSLSEATNPEYGFCTDENLSSVTRRMRPSNYANIMGTTAFEGADNMGHWWLRSPGGVTSGAAEVFPVGQLNTDSESVTWINIGCVPVMHIRLRSTQWYFNNDGTSGSGGSYNQPGSAAVNPPNRTVNLSAPRAAVKIASANSVKLSWTRVSGASGYYIYRSTAKNGSYARIASVKGTVFTNVKLKKGKTYYYRVSAFYGRTESARSGIVSRKIEGKPKKPKLSVAFSPSKGEIVFSWKGLKKQPKGAKIAIYAERKQGSRKVKKQLRAFPAKRGGKYIYRIKKGDRAFYGNVFYKRDGVKISGKNTRKLNV